MKRLLGLLWLLVACAHGSKGASEGKLAQSTTPFEQARTQGPWYGDLHALAAEAARARGLTLSQKFEVVELEDAAFFAQMEELHRDLAQEVLKDFRETGAALSLGVTSAHPFHSALREEAKGVRGEQLIAFYHFASDRLVVRKTLPSTLRAMGELERGFLLAHEVGHVLQDQLGLGVVVPTSFEEALARRAVLEGDANLTAILLNAVRQGVSPERAVERVRIATGALTPQQLVEFSGQSPKLLSSSTLVRDLFMFPYLRGQGFVTDLYAAGGLALVDAMLKAPPQTTDAIFRPQHWLDGGGQRLRPAGPASHRVGALMLRSLLDVCGQQHAKPIPPEGLAWVERHYVDDTLQQTGDKLVWVTSWDAREPFKPVKETSTQTNPAPDDAQLNMQGAEGIMRILAQCLPARPEEFSFVTRGTVVALSIRDPEGASAAVQLLQRQTAPAPLGRQVIPPPRLSLAYRSVGQGSVRDGRWVHDKLALTMHLPEGSQVWNNPGASLSVVTHNAAIIGVFLDQPGNERGANGFLISSANSFFKEAGKGPSNISLATQYAWKPRVLDGSQMRETSVHFEGGFEARGRVVTMCGGRATFYAVAFLLAPETAPMVDAWWQSLRGGAEAPICSEP